MLIKDDIAENICKEFDERLKIADSKLQGLTRGSKEWQDAFDKRCQILDALDRDVRDFLFQNSEFVDVQNTRKISELIYMAVTEETGRTDNFFVLYEWYCQFERMIIDCFRYATPCKGHGFYVTKAKIIPQDILDGFDMRLGNGEDYNKVTNEFLQVVYYNSRVQNHAHGGEFHRVLVNHVYDDVVDFLDRREFCTLYNTYESLILNSFKLAGLIKIHVF